jgi:predicted RNase H-like HicB family nuclease
MTGCSTGIRSQRQQHPSTRRASNYQRAKLNVEILAVRQIEIIVEKHPDGHVAYPLGIQGVVVGEGDTYEAAVADVKSAIKFHIESFGSDVL